MDTQFTYNGRPVFIDSQCAYYLDDNNKKVCITLAGGSTRTRIKKVIVPPAPILNGVFTLSANGSTGTIQSSAVLTSNPIRTDISTGYPGNLRVRIQLTTAYPVGSFVRIGISQWGTIKTIFPSNVYELDTLSNANWSNGSPVDVINSINGNLVSDLIINTPIWIMVIPTSQAITTINFTSSNNPSTGITSTGIYNGLNSILTVSGSNGYATGAGNSIAIGDNPLGNGFAAQVTAVNFSTENSANNFELTWTKTGTGMATTTSWTIN